MKQTDKELRELARKMTNEIFKNQFYDRLDLEGMIYKQLKLKYKSNG